MAKMWKTMKTLMAIFCQGFSAERFGVDTGLLFDFFDHDFGR